MNPGFPANCVATKPATDYFSWVLRNVMRNIMWPVRELVCGWGDEDACHVHARAIALLALLISERAWQPLIRRVQC